MAISANGFIASKDGSEDFLSHTNWVQFVKRAKQVGGFIYGKTTYESVITWGDEYLHGLSNVIKVVISTKKFQPAKAKTASKSKNPQEQFVAQQKSDMQKFLDKLS